MNTAISAVLTSMRLPFLILTPACVFLGVSAVIANNITIDIYMLGLALLGATLAHISVNTLNEYSDFKTGLDFKTQRTPFSGGSGALPQHPKMATAVLCVGLTALLGTVLIGLFFLWKFGLGIIPIGAIGVALVIAYTPWVTKNPYLCLIGPGLGFGLLIVAGTGFVLTGEHALLPWFVGSVPFLLINNLLLLNQYPDIEADRSIGRNNVLIAHGVKCGNRIYGLFVLLTIAVIVGLILAGILPTLSFLALLPMPLALFALNGAMKYGNTIGGHPKFLAANVVVAVLTPILLGVSIIFG